MEQIDTTNKFMVGGGPSDKISIMSPCHGSISREDALLLAAWIVALADPGMEDFKKVFEAICST